jgi:hypothetical protein
MTPDERERMNELCKRIVDEQDPQTFDRLVVGLNDLLEGKHRRIHPEHKKAQSTDVGRLFGEGEEFPGRPL